MGLLRKVFCAALLLVACAAAQQVEPASEQELVRLVNQERVRAGLPEFAVDERLTKVAREHSALMARKVELSHQLDGEPDLRHRIASTSLHFNSSAENVAYDPSVPGAHRGLMNSLHHRENIMNPTYNAIGIGIVRKGEMIYVTQDFARKLPEIGTEQAEQTIARAFDDLRIRSGAKPLPLRPRPELRKMACDMAAKDGVDPKVPADIKGVHNIIAYTETEIEHLSPDLEKLRRAQASGYSIGACYARSASYANAVYWVIVITYY